MNSAKLWKDLPEMYGIPGASLVVPLILVLMSVLGFWQDLEQKFVYPIKYSGLVEQYAAEYELPQALLYAVIHTESKFKPKAESSAGALGLTQITPETFEWLQGKTRESLPLKALHEPKTSIRYGALFLSMLQQEFSVTETALAAYHAGRSRVNGWLRNRKFSGDGKTLAHIPVPETSHYVRKVMKAYGKYQKLYPNLQ